MAVRSALLFSVVLLRPAHPNTPEDVSKLAGTLAGLSNDFDVAVESLYFALMEALPDSLFQPEAHFQPDGRHRAIWAALHCAREGQAAHHGDGDGGFGPDLSELEALFGDGRPSCPVGEYICAVCRRGEMDDLTRAELLGHLRARLDLARDGYTVVRGPHACMRTC